MSALFIGWELDEPTWAKILHRIHQAAPSLAVQAAFPAEGCAIVDLGLVGDARMVIAVKKFHTRGLAWAKTTGIDTRGHSLTILSPENSDNAFRFASFLHWMQTNELRQLADFQVEALLGDEFLKPHEQNAHS